MAHKPWEEDFDFYFSELKKARLVVALDLGAAEVAPLPSHPWKLQARINMLTPREDGLRRQQEADALFELEDRLVTAFEERLPLLYVGRIIAAGQVTLIWYAPAAVQEHLEALTEVVLADRGEYEVKLSLSEDPAWCFYFDFLFPDVYNLQVMLNRRRLMTLEDHGDDGLLPRELDHLCHFPTYDQAAKASRLLATAGFQVDEIEEAIAPSDHPEEAGWTLQFQRLDRLAQGQVDDVCIKILDIILPLDGHYEGWGVTLLGSGNGE